MSPAPDGPAAGRLIGARSAASATVVTAACLVALALALVLRAQRIPAPDPAIALQNASAIVTGVNPNTAPAAELTVLPGIGPGRAKAIVAFREANRDTAGPGEPVFKRPDDLRKVSGIGPKTVEKLRPWLTFDD
ncbi:MAG: helix-hairpin-helix domain-containing protein [Phycisphaerae bacterium]